MIEHARSRQSKKRGGDFHFTTLNEAKAGAVAPDSELLSVDEALRQLEKEEPDLAVFVKLRPVKGKLALKIIKLGLNTKEVVARFETERQALALMDHPNIAKILDAGSTETGRPYFVMELVRGIPITRFCDEANETVGERLELFLDVCRVVQHAHQKGVIYRDLKPSNIMVTMHDDRPVPKVIDLGVAKATQGPLTDQTLFTRFEMLIGTPAYMSPEQTQLSGLDIDTRSDVYALGILLYELLTGRTSLDPRELLEAGDDEIKRRIREDEPLKMSIRISTMKVGDLAHLSTHYRSEPHRFLSTIRGDLDWIVMKAMGKTRIRQYETASAMVSDLQLYPNDEPVEARPPSLLYRFGKFTKKHRSAMIVMTAFFILAFLGLAGIVWQWRIAIANEALAEQRFEIAEESKLRAISMAEERNAALVVARSNEGKSWFERALINQDQPNGGFHSALMAGRSLGFRGFGKDGQNADFLRDYPVLLDGHTNLINEADALVRMQSRSPRPFWSSPATAHHQNWVRLVAFSPDGRILASGSDDHTIIVWDAIGKMKLATLRRHKGRITSLAFSPDGETLVSGSEDNLVVLWRRNSGWKSRDLIGHRGQVRGVAFSPDGLILAYASLDHSVKLWDMKTRNMLPPLLGHTDQVVSLAFNPDGKTLVSGSFDKTFKIWDLEKEGSL